MNDAASWAEASVPFLVTAVVIAGLVLGYEVRKRDKEKDE